MNDRPWWTFVIQWGAWAIIMTLVMGGLNRARLHHRNAETDGRLRYPLAMWIVGVVCLLFFAGLTIVMMFVSEPVWWVTVIFSAATFFSGLTLLDCIMSKHQTSRDGLRYRRLLGKTGFLQWRELGEVRYRAGMKCFQLKTRSGDVVKISVGLAGLPEFARAVIESAPQEALDNATRQVLEETAAGRPPSIW